MVSNKKYAVILMILLSILVSNIGMAKPQSIEFNFMDEDIRVVLHTLAKVSDIDMIMDDSIKGNITMKLKDVTVDEAVDIITSAKGLSYRKMGNSYIIEPADMGMTNVIKLNYTRASDIKKSIEPIASSLKVKVEIDDITNSLLIFGSPGACTRIKTILEDLDVLQQQVTLEAKIVSVNKSNIKDLGFDWKFSEFIKHPDEFSYQAKINALVTNGNAKILASPKVTTINGKEARILVGDRIPVMTETITDSKTTQSVTYIDAGIKLTFTPSVTADGNITTKVRTEVSTPILVAATKNYQITTREVESNVSLKDGETMVIGGLIGSDETKNLSKIPFLSELPVLGSLFKSQHNSKTETELVIFLTAKVVK